MPSFDDCFITRARQAALESDIVIVNHHLFFADLALRDKEWGQVLPDYSAVIFDEAHQIEDVAAQYFGAHVSSYQVEDLIGDITRLPIHDVETTKELTKVCARLSKYADHFWMAFAGDSSMFMANDEGRFVLKQSMFVRKRRDGEYEATPLGERYMALKAALQRLIAALNVVKDAPPEMEAIVRRAEQLRFDLEFIVLGDDEGFVYWCERRGRGFFLQGTPIDASGILNDRLFSQIESVIMTSATLTSAGSFNFVRERLGIGEAAELVAESNFDYEQQAMLYLPQNMPDPRQAGFTETAAAEIIKLLKASQGRAFVLSTSYSQMQRLRDLVEPEVDFPILMQGESSRSGLLEKFRTTPNAVLFATASFWQGVDVRGEALSCVIIDKLPFAVPSDPVVAARQRYIDNQGGSSFNEYSVPSAIISLKQGVGRLIRSTTDRGVIALLDPRLLTKSYGRQFLESLPHCRITQEIEAVEDFFAS
jgi:ATP-dependent DNA helicase DinG